MQRISFYCSLLNLYHPLCCFCSHVVSHGYIVFILLFIGCSVFISSPMSARWIRKFGEKKYRESFLWHPRVVLIWCCSDVGHLSACGCTVLVSWTEGKRVPDTKNNKNVCNFLLLSLMLCCYLHVMMSQPWVEGRLYLSLIPFVQLTPLVDCCACGCCWCLAVCCYLMPINRWCRQFAFISDVAQRSLSASVEALFS